MADISAIKPAGASGASYNLKDATARTNISTLSTTVQSLGGRVTSLETDMQAVKNNIQSTYFSGEYGSDPEEDYGFTDCGYTVIVDATRWIYDDNDRQIQRTYHETWSYYSNLTDAMERVGTPKVGDIIFVKELASMYISGPMPSDTTIGYLSDVSGLDGRYVQKSPPEPIPPGGFPIVGSGQHVSLGNSYYLTYKAFYIVGFATVNVPSEEVEGKTDTLLIAKCFATEY